MEKQTSFNCIICREDSIFVSIGKCKHQELCLKCTLRIRTYYGDKKCPLCQTHCDNVVITEYNQAESEYIKDEDDYETDPQFNINGIFYDGLNAHSEAISCLNFICRLCSTVFETFFSLANHLKRKHNKFLWCVYNQ